MKRTNKKVICGIYKITDIVTNKIYVGSAKDIEERWKEHKSLLRRNKHTNSHLQSAWNLDGESNFVFEVIEECPETERFKREQYYLDLTQCYNDSIGYNIAKKAGDYDKKATDLKISEALKNKPAPKRRKTYATFSEEQIKQVIDLLLENQLSVAKIADITKVSESTIKNILYRNGWSYLTEGIEFPQRTSKRGKDDRTILNEDDVHVIIKRLLNGESSKEIAKDYKGLRYQSVDSIRRHDNWKDLTEGIEFPNINRRGARVLTKEEVVDILHMHKNGKTINEIREKYPKVVSVNTFKAIINGDSWKEIDRNSI